MDKKELIKDSVYNIKMDYAKAVKDMCNKSLSISHDRKDEIEEVYEDIKTFFETEIIRVEQLKRLLTNIYDKTKND